MTFDTVVMVIICQVGSLRVVVAFDGRENNGNSQKVINYKNNKKYKKIVSDDKKMNA